MSVCYGGFGVLREVCGNEVTILPLVDREEKFQKCNAQECALDLSWLTGVKLGRVQMGLDLDSGEELCY